MEPPVPPRHTYGWLFPCTIFLSAFLLFQVQPIAGRYLLPQFGGGPAVWTTCLLFFQLALLAGYAYAHWLGSRPTASWQANVHFVLLAASLVFVPAGANWHSSVSASPVADILLLLAVGIGVPYFVLASTGPLLQRWFSLAHPGVSPYRLYALSNTGSLLALLSYPFVFEPLLRLRTQTLLWSGAYVVFAGLCAWAAWRVRRVVPSAAMRADSVSRVPVFSLVFWLLLAACGSTLLLATTNQMCQEIAVIPFLWVLPLSIYLLTFILTFDSDFWYRRRLFAMATGLLVPIAVAYVSVGLVFPLWSHIAVYSATLFCACMLCHGQLARSRPEPAHLTMFYLLVAAGGALGGVFVALAAPHLFTTFAEYPVGLSAACALGFIGMLRNGGWNEWRTGSIATRGAFSALLLGALTPLVAANVTHNASLLAAWRNFYGTLRVQALTDSINGRELELMHGKITHGTEFLDPAKLLWPTSYYGPDSGVGVALDELAGPKRRIGIVGLGAGTLAAYGRPGDEFRFYEINPDVVTVATRWFRYVRGSKATVSVVLGDARVSMERELAQRKPQQFDLLAVDAFSGDAIPIHLLTAECADIYRRELKPGGLLLLHISNRSLDLAPVTLGMARHLGWEAVLLQSQSDPEKGESAATWVLLTGDRQFAARPEIEENSGIWERTDKPLVWTDDFASLWHVLQFRRRRQRNVRYLNSMLRTTPF